MLHPDVECQKTQEKFLSQCSESDREFHAPIFRIGNAAYIYHRLSFETDEKLLVSYYREWLEGLPSGIREDMKKKGFEECKTMFSFTRYVNERNDIGKDEWMKQHLSESDYQTYIYQKNLYNS